ncbi:uncharacterized protein LOC132699851 isoform X2 [Cylas formicarius]|uniref:uncharacterized protein LOC132699851 isoform X2 n=1 Tax=Cylas formicarius TaxID=197179 RepID=UPI002958AD93|nr:uncharacterized protein LOC132699851 isoform X2 [Cylas formicarius]
MDFGDALSRARGLDTVRALHQTIVALRAALEQSKREILELKAKTTPVEPIRDTLGNLSVENHVLRKTVVDKTEDERAGAQAEALGDEKPKHVTIVPPKKSCERLVAKIRVKARKSHGDKCSRSLESLTVVKAPADKKFSFTKTISFSNLTTTTREFQFKKEFDGGGAREDLQAPEMDDKKEEYDETDMDEMLSPQNDLEQEVDDIELIFTTDDTKEQDFKEQLVPIDLRESSNSNLLHMPLSDIDQISDKELDDDVFNDENENPEMSSFPVKREDSMFNSKSDNSINHEEKSLKSYYSYQDSSFENKSLEKDESFDRFEERIRIVETDISKVGIHEVEYVGGRRNTCPNPIQYRPLPHREAISKGLNPRKARPILTHSNAIRRDSGAQTDISAIPGSSWRSESSLASKARLGENFTTLPSKFPLPGTRLRLSEKTVEARRVLLSDIGFTSMVPELSRSADHLCPGNLKPPTVTTYGQFLRTTDLYSPGCNSQKFTWTGTTATPSECSQTHSRYSSIYPLSSPPAPSRRCSAPVSPSRRAVLRPTPSKVRFANGSLPELRGDWTTVDSGDSTDSLVEEAESYLRRSIDCIVSGREMSATYSRASAPEPSRDNVPPIGWQPFLPRLPRDLKPDHWVKVITPEGRVRGGRVRYVGPMVTQSQEHFVGVQLAGPDGVSDGTYGNRRYFLCEPCHGLFVPFKKVIMGWRP